MQFTKTIEDTSGDETEVSIFGKEVRVEATVGGDSTLMYLTPKKARKYAVALITAAALVEANGG